MEISRTQPMRPAEIDLIDAVGELETLASTHTQSISDLADGIADEISDREQADSALSASIDTIANDTIPALGDRVTTLEGRAGDFLLGLTQAITVPANESVSSSETFATPFPDTELCGVYPYVIATESYDLFELTVTECTHSGFSFNVSNVDTDPHDIMVGYLAVSFGMAIS